MLILRMSFYMRYYSLRCALIRFCTLNIRSFWKYYAHCALIRSNAIKGLKLDSECATIPFKHASRELWPQQTLITFKPVTEFYILIVWNKCATSKCKYCQEKSFILMKSYENAVMTLQNVGDYTMFIFFLICDLLVAFFHYQLCSYCHPGYGFCVRTWGISFARTFFFFCTKILKFGSHRSSFCLLSLKRIPHSKSMYVMEHGYTDHRDNIFRLGRKHAGIEKNYICLKIMVHFRRSHKRK